MWYSGYSSPDWQYELPMQECFFDVVPLMASFPTDPLYASLDLEPTTTIQGDNTIYKSHYECIYILQIYNCFSIIRISFQ